jgi:hypothetical protein
MHHANIAKLLRRLQHRTVEDSGVLHGLIGWHVAHEPVVKARCARVEERGPRGVGLVPELSNSRLNTPPHSQPRALRHTTVLSNIMSL